MVRGQWANLARMPGLHPYSFSKDIPGFLKTTESQDLGLTSQPKDGAFSQYSVPSLHRGVRTHTDHRLSPPWWSHLHLFQQQPSFLRSLPSRYWPAQPCLASVGCRVIWLLAILFTVKIWFRFTKTFWIKNRTITVPWCFKHGHIF